MVSHNDSTNCVFFSRKIVSPNIKFFVEKFIFSVLYMSTQYLLASVFLFFLSLFFFDEKLAANPVGVTCVYCV